MLDTLRDPSVQMLMAICSACVLLAHVIYYLVRFRKHPPRTRDWIKFSAGALGWGIFTLCFLANWAERLAKVE